MTTLNGSTTALAETLEHHHLAASESLDGPGGPQLRGVTWLSAHLAGVEHALYPAVRDDSIVERNARSAHDINKVLRLLEQQLSGDAMTDHNTRDLIHRLAELMQEHTAAERALVASLDDWSDEQEIERLSVKLDSAMHHGPTRPHLHGPHSGPLEPIAFAAHAARDHVLDVLDARSKPLEPEREPQQPVGRWGRYWVGMGRRFDG